MMVKSMTASHAMGKKLSDAIFGASAAASEAVRIHGSDKVINATIGAFLDENEKLACIPTVEKVFRKLSIEDIIQYAPIAGLPEYLNAVIDLTFSDQRPDGYVAAVATAGGAGAVHHAIANYAEIGDQVLTADWFWGPYNVLCREAGCHLTTYSLFDEDGNFNVRSFSDKVTDILRAQNSLLIIINTPAHNPTGYTLTENDWSQVLEVCRKCEENGKRIFILVDIAYIDYAGEKSETRRFMKLFENLPDTILVMFAFSMSKGYTMYGQRMGALIGLSSDKDIISEFSAVNEYTSRATWSNTSRAAMTTLIQIQSDNKLLKRFEAEREGFYQIIKHRASVFMDEAAACGLPALPYKAGFFISIPSHDPAAVCHKLHDDLVFAVPLKLGVRIAVCAVSSSKMTGLAGKMMHALQFVEGR